MVLRYVDVGGGPFLLRWLDVYDFLCAGIVRTPLLISETIGLRSYLPTRPLQGLLWMRHLHYRHYRDCLTELEQGSEHEFTHRRSEDYVGQRLTFLWKSC